MSTQFPIADAAPKPSHKGRRIAGWIVTVVASLIIGANLGAGDQPEPTAAAVETVEITPAVCVTAINEADQVIVLAGEGFGAAADAMGAAAEFDVVGIQAATAKMAALNDQVSAIDYRTSADQCLAGAQ